jgi:hypothetical protein
VFTLRACLLLFLFPPQLSLLRPLPLTLLLLLRCKRRRRWHHWHEN